MALSCREIVELVTDYLDGQLDQATVAQVRHHLTLCDGCEIYFEQIRQTANALGKVPVDTLPTSMQDQLITAFRTYRPVH